RAVRWARAHPVLAATLGSFTITGTVLYIVLSIMFGPVDPLTLTISLPILCVAPFVAALMISIDRQAREMRRAGARITEAVEALPPVLVSQYVSKRALTRWLNGFGLIGLVTYVVYVILTTNKIPTPVSIFWPGLIYWSAGSGLGAMLCMSI